MAPVEGTNWAGHDLELFPSLARRLLGLVVWYGLNVATFGGFSYSKRAGLKLVHTRKKHLKSPEI